MKFVGRPSACRHQFCGINYLWTYHVDFFSNFICWLPRAIRRAFFFNFGEKIGFLRIFFFFFNKGRHGSKNIKTLLLLQIAAESFQTSPESSSQWCSLRYCFVLLKFWVYGFNAFSLFSLTWDPMEAKSSKRYCLLKSLYNFWIFFSIRITKLLFWIFKFWVSDC